MLNINLAPDDDPEICPDATRLISIEASISDLKAEADHIRSSFRAAAMSEAEAAIRAGRAPTTHTKIGAAEGHIKVIIREAYSAIPTSNEAGLRKAFGATFGALIERRATVKVTGATSALIALVDEIPALADLLTIKETLHARKGFLATACGCVADGVISGDDVADLFAATIAKPTIRRGGI